MTKTKLFSKTVLPICTLKEAKEKGKYTYVYDRIDENTVPLTTVTGSKKVYLVPVDKTITTEQIPEYLKEKGLKPCENAPEYLLGLMAVTDQEELPNYSWIVAANAASVFRGSGDDRCFLCVDRDDGERGLYLVSLGGDWSADSAWVFLAEDLEPSNPEPLDSSDTLTLEARVKSLEDTVETLRKFLVF